MYFFFRKNELGNLLDDLEAGELIDSERISKRTSSKREEGSDSEHEVKEDERTEILSRYVPSPGKESQGEKFVSLSLKKSLLLSIRFTLLMKTR